MKKAITLAIILGLSSATTLQAQRTLYIDMRKSEQQNCTAEMQGDSIHLMNRGGKGSGILWMKDINMQNGTIELDLKGKDVRGESFLGVAFRGLNDSTYSAVYFRPFNFRNSDRKNFSAQYMDAPRDTWDVLREKHPGKYENAVAPVPEPNGWFHAAIVIDFPSVKVFVNGSREPSLVVNQLNDRKDGRIGLWIDSKDGWFRNVKVTPK